MDSIYFEDPLGLLIELASYRFEPPFGYTHADVLLEAHKIRVARGDRQHRRGAPRRRHRDSSSRGRASRCRTTDRPKTRTETTEEHMAEIKLHVLKPSVNNLTARVFVRAAGLDFEEIDVCGQDHQSRVSEDEPGPSDADARGAGPAAGDAVGELRDHAVPLQQARAGAALPERSSAAGDGRQRHVLSDRHALSPGRPRHLSGAARSRSTRARWAGRRPTRPARPTPSRRPRPRWAEPLDVYREFFIGRQAVHRR